jgi:hypothetical protein
MQGFGPENATAGHSVVERGQHVGQTILKRLQEMSAQESPERAAALRRLAVFQGGFTLEETSCLERAVEAFEDALRYYTPLRDPLNDAKTQANLGLAREDLGDQDRALACCARRCSISGRWGSLISRNRYRRGSGVPKPGLGSPASG